MYSNVHYCTLQYITVGKNVHQGGTHEKIHNERRAQKVMNLCDVVVAVEARSWRVQKEKLRM